MAEETFGYQLDWRSLTSGDLEREYSPSSCVGGNLTPFLTEYADQSAASRQWCADAGIGLKTINYGDQPSQSIDLVVPERAPAPLVVYIHGGYWQALSKLESFGPASDFVSSGVAYAAVDYTLAPLATLDQIVAECRMAARALHAQSDDLNLDPDRIVLAGSSAGAHLAAMVALDPEIAWVPAGIVLLSGVYELEPLLGTSVNDALSLDHASAARNSPAREALGKLPRAVVAWGDNETHQFKRQSQLFAEKLRSAGVTVAELEAPGRNHFNIVGDLGSVGSVLGSAVADLLTASDSSF